MIRYILQRHAIWTETALGKLMKPISTSVISSVEWEQYPPCSLVVGISGIVNVKCFELCCTCIICPVSIDYFLKMFKNFDIIIDSQEATKHSTEDPCTLHPVFCSGYLLQNYIVKYQNQETDIGTIHRIYSVFSSDRHSFVCVHTCVCVVKLCAV